MEYLDLMKKRVEVISFNRETTLNNDEIIEVIKECLAYTPAAFNMPTSQIVVLLEGKHELLWDIIIAGLEKAFASRKPEAFELLKSEINKLKEAKGTILFLEDTALVEDLKESYAMYAEDFATWSKEHMGMLQLNIAQALLSAGIGTSLQHYNEILKNNITALMDLPKGCQLISQMVFGGIKKSTSIEKLDDIEQRIQICKE